MVVLSAVAVGVKTLSIKVAAVGTKVAFRISLWE